MRIKVLLYLMLEDGNREAQVEVDVKENETCEELFKKLRNLYNHSALSSERCFFSKNGSYANAHTTLEEGDELLILPPISHN